VFLSVCVQAQTPFIFSFSGRREGGSSFQAAQKHVDRRNSISSGRMSGHLKHSGHSSVLVMEPTQNGNRGHAMTLTRQNRGSFSFGNLLVDPLMGPCPIEIRTRGTQNTMPQLFIEDQHVSRHSRRTLPRNRSQTAVGRFA
jgi:hypothetical protein